MMDDKKPIFDSLHESIPNTLEGLNLLAHEYGMFSFTSNVLMDFYQQVTNMYGSIIKLETEYLQARDGDPQAVPDDADKPCAICGKELVRRTQVWKDGVYLCMDCWFRQTPIDTWTIQHAQSRRKGGE